MCNRYASRQIASRLSALLVEAGGRVDVDRTVNGARLTRLVVMAEDRKERRGFQVARVRRERRAEGLYHEARGTREWQLYDEACWTLQRLYERGRVATEPAVRADSTEGREEGPEGDENTRLRAHGAVDLTYAEAMAAKGYVDALDADIAADYPEALHPDDPRVWDVPADLAG